MAHTTSDHPTLLKDQVASLLVQPLETSSFVLSSGVRIFNSSEPLKIPRLVSSGTVDYVAEGAEIPDDYDVTFNEISLMPTSRKSIKSITRYTNELLRASSIGLDSVLKSRLVSDVSSKLDSELLAGTGAADSITGILNQPGVQTGDLDVEDPDSFLDALALTSAAEVQPTRWFINGADFIALRKVKDNGGVYVVPAFAGLGAPHWDMYARGAILGLTRGAGRNHIIRAALESIAYQSDDVITAMRSDMNSDIRVLKVDGGASANNLLMQFQADISDLEVIRPAQKEATAAGAALLAGKAVGFYQDLLFDKQLNTVFKPYMAADERRRLLDGWRRAVKACLASEESL